MGGDPSTPRELILITQSLKELKLLVSDYVGIVRNNERMGRAMKRLDLLYEETESLYQRTIVSLQLCELRNMITVAYLIVKSNQFRHESRGLHFNTDYPEKGPILQNIDLQYHLNRSFRCVTLPIIFKQGYVLFHLRYIVPFFVTAFFHSLPYQRCCVCADVLCIWVQEKSGDEESGDRFS